MTGYQETITDQSFNGQIITFTYPMVGNYGVNRDDYESISPTCKGVVVKEHACSFKLAKPNDARFILKQKEFLEYQVSIRAPLLAKSVKSER